MPVLNEFHYYNKLPVELKLMIWEIIAEEELSHGAHRFRLEVRSKGSLRVILMPSDNTRLQRSTWRRAHELASIDPFADHVFSAKNGKGTMIYRDAFFPNQEHAMRIDLKNDLLTLRFGFGRSVEENMLLSENINVQINQLAGITRIGFNSNFIMRGFGQSIKSMPFRCSCPPGTNHYPSFCRVGLYNFLEWFVNLETVYVIVGLRTLNLRVRRVWPHGIDEDEFVAHRRHAVSKGLDAFQDDDRYYTQMESGDRESPIRVESFQPIFNKVARLEAGWLSHPKNPSISDEFDIKIPRKPLRFKVLSSHIESTKGLGLSLPLPLPLPLPNQPGAV